MPSGMWHNSQVENNEAGDRMFLRKTVNFYQTTQHDLPTVFKFYVYDNEILSGKQGEV